MFGTRIVSAACRFWRVATPLQLPCDWVFTSQRRYPFGTLVVILHSWRSSCISLQLARYRGEGAKRHSGHPFSGHVYGQINWPWAFATDTSSALRGRSDWSGALTSLHDIARCSRYGHVLPSDDRSKGNFGMVLSFTSLQEERLHGSLCSAARTLRDRLL